MTALYEYIAGVRLIGQHMHGCWQMPGDRRRFENALNEANTDLLADFDSGFDTQLGFAVRTHCAPLLGVPKHAEPQDYWRRRRELSEDELARIFLPAAGVSDWLVDTGYADGVADVAQIAAWSGNRAYEVIRLERVAEQAAASPGDYAGAFEQNPATARRHRRRHQIHPGVSRRIRRRPQ
jgi:predicted TIM-barrel fold metal-dependent hydrolase